MGKHPYEEILYRERPELYGRPRMSRIDRAAQFAPFAALTGYEAVIRETERCTDTRMELEEQEKESLDRRLGALVRLGESAPAVEITCFVPDERKSGGAYQSITGKIKADLIALDDETIDETKPLAIYDSNAKWKNMRLEPGTYRVRELLVPVFIDGKQVYESPATMDIQAYCNQEKASLWDEHLRLNNPHIVPVDLSDKLTQLKTKLIDNMSKR